MAEAEGPTFAATEKNGDKQTFSVRDVLFCTPHGNMSKQPAKIFNLTSALPNTNTLAPRDLVAAAERVCTERSKDGQAVEIYRSTKTGVLNFTVTIRGSYPLARFRVPAHWHSDIVIKFNPSAFSPSQTQQKIVTLHQTPAQKARLSRSYSFVHNSCMYTWKFVSGMEIRLHFPHNGLDKVMAKFFFKPSWFRSCGVLAMGREDEAADRELGAQEEVETKRLRMQEAREVWERVVVVTLLAVLRREREWRYMLAGHLIPLKRTIC